MTAHVPGISNHTLIIEQVHKAFEQVIAKIVGHNFWGRTSIFSEIVVGGPKIVDLPKKMEIVAP